MKKSLGFARWKFRIGGALKLRPPSLSDVLTQLRDFTQDFRYALRMLLKNPGHMALATLTLALGIGANTTIFSWINSTLLNPVPGLTRTNDLVCLSRGKISSNPSPFSYPDYVDLRERSRSFSKVTAFTIASVNVGNSSQSERMWATLASANYFDVLGVRPILGRGFLPAEDTKVLDVPVIVISFRLWQTRFGANPSVIGQTLYVNRRAYTVVGVTPQLFQGSQTGLRTDMWLPIIMEKYIIPGGDVLELRGKYWFMLLAKLKTGIQRQQAQQETNLVMQHIVAQFPDAHKGDDRVVLYPLWRAPFGVNGYLYILFPVLMAIAGVVLLLACTNVANLLLVRSVARRREIAIRLSFGATRSRLVRMLLVESFLLAFLGGGTAAVLSIWSSRALGNLIPPTGLPISIDAHLDSTVLLAALVTSILSGVLFGIVPALRSSRVTPAAVLKEGMGRMSAGRQTSRLTEMLVVAQLSLSLFLVICAGLFIRTFQHTLRFDPGFNPDHVLLASIDLFAAGYSESDGIQFQQQVLARIENLPGVHSATLANWEPLGFGLRGVVIRPEAYVPQARESMEIGSASVGPNYFRTMQIPLTAGREFTYRDTQKSEPVAVVNQALTDRYWPHQDVVGKRLYAGGRWLAVIGVARNSNYANLNEAPQPFLYMPAFQNYSAAPDIHVRASTDPLVLASAVESAIHRFDEDLPVFDVMTLKSRVEIASSGQRIAGFFVGAFGLVALLLAAVGIYGVISFNTRQRQHEIGIRMAVGAQRWDVLWLVLKGGLRLTLIGEVIGLALSFALTRFVGSMLFATATTDTLTFASVAIILAFISLVACYIPARHASFADPLASLREP
jgi:predicted permease